MLGNLFKRKSLDERSAEAEDLFSSGDFAEALRLFEGALHRSRKEAPERHEALTLRSNACRDAMAKQRIAEGKRLLAEGANDLAMEEFQSAEEIAIDAEILHEARQLRERKEDDDATVEQQHQLTEDEELEALSGSWEPEQAAEYEDCGADFRDALLALQEQRSAAAVTAFQALIEAAGDPRYLHFELGRAQVQAGEDPAAAAAFREFLGRIGPDEGGDSRLRAHMELARIAREAGDEDAAVAQFEAAIEAAAEDPRPYLAFGYYLRAQGEAEAAVQVLEAAELLTSELRPDWRIGSELGLALRDAGNNRRAGAVLEGVVDLLVQRGVRDLPVEATEALAELSVTDGNIERAADLYRNLSEGSDEAHRARYLLRAGALVAQLGLKAEAGRLLRRVSVVGNEEECAEANKLLTELGNGG